MLDWPSQSSSCFSRKMLSHASVRILADLRNRHSSPLEEKPDQSDPAPPADKNPASDGDDKDKGDAEQVLRLLLFR